MIPLLWRYSIGHFLKITLACVLAFIAILLTMRLDEIAHFAALGAPLSYILLFAFYQIPYILPIALPLSCLIASLIFVQRLSNTHELTALRACGFALRDLIAPILITAAFLSLFNFWMVSEVATQTHLQTNLLKSELRSINPLLLLNNKHLMRLKGLYFESLGPSRVGESASDAILAIPSKHHQRLNLLIAQHLKASPSVFIGQGVTLLTSSASDQAEAFDDLLIENMEESITHVEDFSQVLQKKVWTINNDYLKLPLLLIRSQEQREALNQAKLDNSDKNQIKLLEGQLNRSHSEIAKRLSIALAVISFTLMGTAFGLNISRHRKHRSLILVILFTTTYLVAFFVAKGLDQQFHLSATLYLAPLIVIALLSIFVINRVSKGIE
ncbi:putative permease, YjgP/YjgQ family [Candidatus Protochlamydia naegleriophila]|uniref:Putative permease, YjgP/YjgQ family n=1 Tax=Candidatus Protochlamydia naegleriophila TaxID=389348 RepID=A0A0U5JE12_9BACT|nr:LptF/LptG family permease [Candidatus Protochlamydia naegleriophila]CUI17028.1 putative permease, YjgP/YjgQ family [Candidatus Protochlamydia naegleriophila]